MAFTAFTASTAVSATQSPRAARWLWVATSSVAVASFVALVTQPAHAQDRDAPRLKTESPYFFVKSNDPTLDQLPLKSTQVDVRISGVIADVTVTQQYKNEGTRTIEAKYFSPAPPRPPCTA